MVIPAQFNTEFRPVKAVGGIADPDAAIAEIVTEITALANPWTLVSAGEYESPKPAASVSADQRSMRVAFSQESPTRMVWHVKDAQGNTITDGRIDMASSPTTVRILAGAHHLVVELESAGVKESGYANIIDTTPFPFTTVGVYVVASAHRNAAGALLHNAADEAQMSDVATASDGRIMGYQGTTNSGKTTGGSILPLPCEVRIEPLTSVHRNAGRLSQMVFVPSDQSPGDQLPVPLDVGVTGSFFVLAKDSSTGNTGRLAVRAG